MVRAPDCRLGGLLFSSTRFKTWDPTLHVSIGRDIKSLCSLQSDICANNIKYPTQGRWKWNRPVVDSLIIKKKHYCNLQLDLVVSSLLSSVNVIKTSAASPSCT